MKNRSALIVVILLVALSSCGTPRVPSPKETPTSAVPVGPATLTPSLAAPPHPTSMPKPVLPPLRKPQVREALPASGTVEFHILHWNDLHGELLEGYNDEGTWIPGVARMSAYIRDAVEKDGRQDVLLLDAGDWFESGALEGETREQKGHNVLSFYQWLGVDAMTVGNHELFLGVPYFLDLAARAAPIQMLSVNLRVSGPYKTCDDQPVLNAYEVYELGEQDGPKVRVAVIGISRGNLQKETYAPITGVCFPSPIIEVEKIYDELMAQEKPDVVILLSHSGIDLDEKIAEGLNADGAPVDLIIGGHSHTWLETPKTVGPTTIVQAGDFGRAIGDLDLVYDRAASRLSVKWKLNEFTSDTPQDPAALAFLEGLGYVSIEPTPAAQNPAYTYLIGMAPVSQSVGFWTLGKGVFPATDSGITRGQPISSHGKQYANGLFAHSPSELRYSLVGQFKSFVTEVSIKETACGDGASFTVLLDGRELYGSGTLLPGDDPRPVTVDVTGGKQLALKTVSGEDVSCDWTIWGDPYLVPAP